MYRASFAFVLVACGPPGPATPPDYGDVPTDTFPQFYGQVPRNIVMISMDTFRRDRLDRYGSEEVTPFLTAIAEAGVTADDHHQCSNWTYASVSCTLAGRHNEEAGMIPQLVAEFDGIWPTGTPFLARYLKDVGTYSIVASSNGWFGPAWNDTDGYNEAFHPSDPAAWPVYEAGRQRLDDAIARGDVVDRWLLHIHLTEPHAPYNPPPEYLAGLDELEPVPWDLTTQEGQYEVSREQWPTMTPEEQALLDAHLRVRYNGELRYIDDEIFRMIADLDFDGLLDDTLVVFWSDHGEAFWEHGQQTHAYTLFGEESDALLFFWAKNILPASFSGPTSSIDLVPTLLGLYGVDDAPAVTGIPLGEAPDDRPLFANAVARLGVVSSVQKAGWKLVFSWTGQVRLYDRTTDPLEQVNLYNPADPHPKAVELWADLRPQVELQSTVVPQYAVLWPIELM